MSLTFHPLSSSPKELIDLVIVIGETITGNRTLTLSQVVAVSIVELNTMMKPIGIHG